METKGFNQLGGSYGNERHICFVNRFPEFVREHSRKDVLLLLFLFRVMVHTLAPLSMSFPGWSSALFLPWLNDFSHTRYLRIKFVREEEKEREGIL